MLEDSRFTKAFHLPLLTFCLFAAVAGEAGAESYLPKMGGAGGSQFNDPCPAGQNLHGFELRVADDVDAIRPVCVASYGPRDISAPVLTSGSGLVERRGPLGLQIQEVAPGWHGGPGGRIERLLCPARTPIVMAMRVQTEGVDTAIVNIIHLFCGMAAAGQAVQAHPSAIFEGPRYVATPSSSGLTIGGKDARTYWHSQECPAGQVAVGIHGRNGIWLDAVGLICDSPRLDRSRPPPKALGRVPSPGGSGPPPEICEAAKKARARNSPAAPGLEAQCRAHLDQEARIEKVGVGSSTTSTAPPLLRDRPAEPSGALESREAICERAREAREKGIFGAGLLEQQCRALGGPNQPRSYPQNPPEPEEPMDLPEPAPEPDGE